MNLLKETFFRPGQVGRRPAGDRAAQRLSELGGGGRGGATFRGGDFHGDFQYFHW